MDFKCFFCGLEFSKREEIVKHVKKFHKQKEGVDSIKCIVNNSGSVQACRNLFTENKRRSMRWSNENRSSGG